MSINLIKQKPKHFARKIIFRLKFFFIAFYYAFRHPRKFYNALSARGKKWAMRSLILLLIILIAIPTTFWYQARHAKAAWWNESWMYRQKIELTNSTGSDLTDFQVSTVVDTASLITAGKMIVTTCADMRFTDSKGQQLDYWIEENNPGCNNAATKVWLKAPKVYSGTNATNIYMYYGNPSATPTQDGNKVFEFFDDFERYSSWADMQNGGWTNADSTVVIENDGGDKVAKLTPGSASNWKHYAVNGNISSQEYVVESRYKTSNSADGMVVKFQNDGNWWGTEHHPVANARGYYNNSDTQFCTPGVAETTGIWHKHVYAVRQNYIRHWVDGAEQFVADSCLVNYGLSAPFKIGWNAHSGYGPAYADDLFVRKYASADPTPSASAEEVGPGPVAYWKFDGNLEDQTSNNYDLTGRFSGAPSYVEGLSGPNSAIDFTNKDYSTTLSYVDATHVQDTSKSWSTDQWIGYQLTTDWEAVGSYCQAVITGNSSNQLTLGTKSGCGSWSGTKAYRIKKLIYVDKAIKYPTNQVTAQGWFKMVDPTSDSYSQTLFRASGDDFSIEPQTNNTIAAYIGTYTQSFSCSTGITTADKKWHFASLSWDGSNARLYYDGKLCNTQSRSTTIDGNETLRIGTRNDGWTQHFRGYIDDVKVYPYRRTANQIQQDYNAGLAGQSTNKGSAAAVGESPKWMTDGLVGHWKMDEASGTTVADASGNGNTGTLTSAQETGTSDASGNSVTTMVDTDGSLSTTDDAYNNMILRFTAACGSIADGTERTITDYTGTPHTFTVATLPQAPDSCSYEIRHQMGGKFGNGLGFDYSNDRVEITDSPSLSITQSITISTWINITTLPGGGAAYPGLVCKGNHITGFCLDLKSSVPRTFALFVDGTQTWSSNSSELQTGNWYNVIAVYDQAAGKLHMYVNGILNRTVNYSGGITDTDGQLRFASDSDGRRFGGLLDDVRIYNRALSPDEVKQLSEYGPRPVGWWKMDETSGETAYDSSGNGNNGTWARTGSHYVNGKYGNAGKMNYTSAYVGDYVNAGHPGSVEMGRADFSISTWVKLSSTQGAGALAGLVTKGAGSSSDKGYELSCSISGSTCGLTFWISDGINRSTSSGKVALNLDDQWHHIEVVAKRDSHQFYYVDGVDIGYNAPTTPLSSFIGEDITNSSNNLLFGSWISSWIANSSMDDIRIYNYARTPAQVQQDMAGGIAAAESGGGPLPDPVAQWKFDEGQGQAAYDSSYQKNNAQLGATSGVDATDPTWTNSGKFGRALSFDGSDDYMETAASTAFDVGTTVTMSAWIYRSSNSADWESITNHIKKTTSYDGYWIGSSANGKIRAFVGPYTNYVETTSAVSNNVWHYVSLVSNGTNFSVYVDGVKASADLAVGSITTTNVSVRIGKSIATGEQFDGLIDEVKIYNSALTPEQIKMDMNQGKELQLGGQTSATGATGAAAEYCIPGDATSCAGPIGEWKFEDGSGGTVADISGNGKDGTWHGTGTYWTQGKIGGGGNLNGDDDYVITNSLMSSPSTETLSMWVYPQSSGVIVSELGQQTINTGYHYIKIGLNTTNDLRGNIWNCNDDLSFGTVSLNQWYFVSLVYDGTNEKAYLNGQFKDSYTCSRSAPGTQYLAFGAMDTQTSGGFNDTGYFQGRIDQVQLFNYARTPAQVAWDYNRGGPVGWWKLDDGEGGTARDSSGNGNTGTLTTMDPPNDWVDGKYGKALDFDGSDDYVTMGNPSSMNFGTGAFSVAGWVKDTKPVANNSFLGWASKGGYSTGLELRFVVGSDGTRYVGGFIGDGVIGGVYDFSIDTWYHISFTRDPSGNWKEYINGTQAFSGSNSQSIGASNWEIGRMRGSSSNVWQGQIDDVRVYNYALTADQVKQVMNEGSAIRFGD
jgi:hypothetical protein